MGTGATMWLPQCHLSNPIGYFEHSQLSWDYETSPPSPTKISSDLIELRQNHGWPVKLWTLVVINVCSWPRKALGHLQVYSDDKVWVSYIFLECSCLHLCQSSVTYLVTLSVWMESCQPGHHVVVTISEQRWKYRCAAYKSFAETGKFNVL